MRTPNLVPGHYLDGGSPIPAIPFNFNQEEEDFKFELAYPDNSSLLLPVPPAVKDDLNDHHHHQTTLVDQCSPIHESKRRRAPFDEDDARERKKQIDRKYRDRIKIEKEQTKQQLDELRGENGSLKQEIEELRGLNGMMSQNIESNSEQMNQVTNNLDELKRKFSRQESFVQALLQKLAPGNNMMKQEEENEINQWKVSVMRQDVKVVGQKCVELWNENMRLKREKLVLQVKVEALCEKIHKDRHPELDLFTSS